MDIKKKKYIYILECSAKTTLFIFEVYNSFAYVTMLSKKKSLNVKGITSKHLNKQIEVIRTLNKFDKRSMEWLKVPNDKKKQENTILHYEADSDTKRQKA